MKEEPVYHAMTLLTQENQFHVTEDSFQGPLLGQIPQARVYAKSCPGGKEVVFFIRHR